MMRAHSGGGKLLLDRESFVDQVHDLRKHVKEQADVITRLRAKLQHRDELLIRKEMELQRAESQAATLRTARE